METVERGVFRKLSEQELLEYEGPLNYITIVETFKPGPHSTTPIRLCMNSSLKYAGISLNDILMKGPSALNDIFGVTLGFRKHRVGFVKDLSKFYQSVEVIERDQHLRRVLWRSGDKARNPDTYVTTTVNFGDRPAGCIAQTAVRETARLYRHIDPLAADFIKDSTFCDDTLGGGPTRDKAVQISENMDKIVSMGGFTYKTTVMSGDSLPPEENSRKVLGLGWNVSQDELFVEVKVNLSEKKKGVRMEPDVEWEELENLESGQITKRTVWRVVLGQYDLLGLTSVFMVQLKLLMRELSAEDGRSIPWDKPIPDDTRVKFLQTLKQMQKLQAVTFPRCVVPEGATADDPILLCFADGSTSAFCTLAYGRWQMENGGFSCRLIAAKTRVAPLRKISVPRLELQGAVASVRLAQQVEEFLGITFARRYFFTDSSAVLGMLRGESASFKEFVGTRVSEVKTKSNPESEWYWVPTDKNLADMGTRPNVDPADMGPESHYQNGMPWMSEEVSRWPVSQSFARPPEEEFRNQAVCLAVQRDHSLIHLERFKSFKKVLRVVGLVFQFIENIRRSMIGRGVRDQEQQSGTILTERNQRMAEIFLMKDSQQGLWSKLKKGELDSLMPRVITGQDPRGVEYKMIVISGRGEECLRVGYDKPELPILECTSPLAKLIMQDYHNVDHAGLDRTVQRTRHVAWIIRAKALAKVVKNNCFTCKIRSKVLQQQIMAPLPASRLPPAPVFDSTAVDLFGPIKIKDTVRGRVTGKCWGVLFCCTVTSAIHLEVSEDYSCDSFLLCLRRFVSLRGTPSRIQSDPGDQLLAAAKELGKWDFRKVTEWATGQRIEWHVIPVASQHFNGVAESMIRVTKVQLTALLKDRRCTKGELDTVLSEVAYIVNSRPLMVKAGEDPWAGGPITPLHLLGGRATIGIPSVQCEDKPSLTKRLRFLESLKEEFWNKWFLQVFPKLIPCQKWRTKFRDVQVGDIVLVKEASLVQKSYMLARVKEVKAGEDGHIRRVILEYKNVDSHTDLKKAKFKETERSIHSLVVIVPADWTEEDVEKAVRGGLQKKPD
jgi:hypothetical protein